MCWPTWHLGDSRLRRRVPLSHHSTHQWRGSTTGVCGCGCGCVLVGGCGCVLVWVCFVCWPTWHLRDSRLRRRVPLSHHSTHHWRGSTTGVCWCGWVLVCVGVCWCVCGCVLVWVCFWCVGPPGISEIPVFVGGSRSLTIPLTNGEAVLQVCVGVWGCGY